MPKTSSTNWKDSLNLSVLFSKVFICYVLDSESSNIHMYNGVLMVTFITLIA